MPQCPPLIYTPKVLKHLLLSACIAHTPNVRSLPSLISKVVSNNYVLDSSIEHVMFSESSTSVLTAGCKTIDLSGTNTAQSRLETARGARPKMVIQGVNLVAGYARNGCCMHTRSGHPCTYCVSVLIITSMGNRRHISDNTKTLLVTMSGHMKPTNITAARHGPCPPPPQTSSGLGCSSCGFPAGGVGVLAILHQCAKKDA